MIAHEGGGGREREIYSTEYERAEISEYERAAILIVPMNKIAYWETVSVWGSFSIVIKRAVASTRTSSADPIIIALIINFRPFFSSNFAIIFTDVFAMTALLRFQGTRFCQLLSFHLSCGKFRLILSYLKFMFRFAVKDGGYFSAVKSQPKVLSSAVAMIPPWTIPGCPFNLSPNFKMHDTSSWSSLR